nr:MAG TPA: hypothetical protein [Caudoviricetes sp.]
MATATKTKIAAPIEAANESDVLKETIAQQQAQMQEMMAQIALLMKAQSAPAAPIEQPKKQNNIKFINLTAGSMNLRGTRIYNIPKQFGFKMLGEAEARLVVNNMPNAIADGYVYIANKAFVHECELDDLYANMLDDAQLKALLSENANDVCEVYKNASEGQKRIIIDMVSDKRLNGQPVDANILVELGKLSGVDFMGIDPLDDKE